MSTIAKLVEEKTGYPNLLNDLNTKLSGSELNTFLLELFRERTQIISATELLKQFEINRFVQPSAADPILFKELEIKYLKQAKSKGFFPIALSPLTSLGTCSAIAFVDQHNVVSAVRGTEIVSDATNVFALLIAKEVKTKKNTSVIKYATAHRHVRSQALSNPAHTAHFGVFCMATGGLDTGNFSFELENLIEHMNFHWSLLSNEFEKDKLFIKILLKNNNDTFHQKLVERLKKFDDSIRIELIKELHAGDYYKLVQFKFFLEHNGNEMNLSDGGFVDWTQKFIPNKKHRLLISGVGTELIYKIKYNKL